MALFTSILAFAGNAMTLAAAAPNARRDFSTSGSGALDGLRAAAEATRTKKQRIDARLCGVRTSCKGSNLRAICTTIQKTGVQRTLEL